MSQSVYDYINNLLGVRQAEEQRRSLERAVLRAPQQLRRDTGGLLAAASESRTPARASDYPEIADAVRGVGFRGRELTAALDRQAEIGQKAAGYSQDIPSVMQLTPNEIRAIGAQGAVSSALDPSNYSQFVEKSPEDTVIQRAGKTALGSLGKLGGAFPLAAKGAEDFIRYGMSSADDPYELEGVRVAREAQEASATRADAMKASNKAVLVAQKILNGQTEDLTEEESVIAQGLTKGAPTTATSLTPQQKKTSTQAGLLEPKTQSKYSGLLGTISQNLQDALVAYGTLEASSPQLVTADDLDKLRTITPTMVLAQSQKIKQGRESRESALYQKGTKQLKDRLAALRGLRDLTKEDDKKLQREAESVMDARQNVDFIDTALGLIDDAYSYGPLGEGVSQFAAARLAGVEGSDAYNLESVLVSLRSRIGFDKLQEMRENSPTGGALGQVSDFENRLLQSTEGNLTIGVEPARMKQTLLDIRDAQMAMVHGIVDNTGRLRRLENRGDLDRLRSGDFRVATAADAGRSTGGVRQFNPATGEFE